MVNYEIWKAISRATCSANSWDLGFLEHLVYLLIDYLDIEV